MVSKNRWDRATDAPSTVSIEPVCRPIISEAEAVRLSFEVGRYSRPFVGRSLGARFKATLGRFELLTPSAGVPSLGIKENPRGRIHGTLAHASVGATELAPGSHIHGPHFMEDITSNGRRKAVDGDFGGFFSEINTARGSVNEVEQNLLDRVKQSFNGRSPCGMEEGAKLIKEGFVDTDISTVG